MASAGRILIMPKGNYDSSVTYEMLDLVKFNGTSWVAKKTVTGIEPSADNSEYWQDMLDIGTQTQISAGNYVGTGNYNNNKNSLTFSFEPKVVMFTTGESLGGSCIWHYGVTTLKLNTSPAQNINFELNGNTLSWYNENAPEYQLNKENTTYYWVAIG